MKKMSAFITKADNVSQGRLSKEKKTLVLYYLLLARSLRRFSMVSMDTTARKPRVNKKSRTISMAASVFLT